MSVRPGPAEQLGELFAAVQESGIFPDSKTFADAVPRRPVAAIVRDWRAATPGDLRSFVTANFELPPVSHPVPPDGLPIGEHIAHLWDLLTRRSDAPSSLGSEIALPHPYVVPGGRFRELYYWDSYFTMLGLIRSGRQDLVEGMVANFGSLIDRFGHIPNGTRTYYLSRSHPPFFYLMAGLSQHRTPEARRRRLDWMRREHAFWMAGADDLPPGGEHRRVVRLEDGSILNRYWDDRAAPRDESWEEDVALARVATQPAASLWRNLRAAAESGWDFSSRWLGDGETLATIRTTRLVPVDLNCLLYGLEHTIADEAAALDDAATATAFTRHAEARAAAVSANLWNAGMGCHADHDLDLKRVANVRTAAMAFALFTGLARPDQAAGIATALRPLVHDGGLATTDRRSSQQWDAPNGWAPLQWIAVSGLRRYGCDELADRIAAGWRSMVAANYDETGHLLEKYDVQRGTAGGGGEYFTETGFGWTNGVQLALTDTMAETQPALQPLLR